MADLSALMGRDEFDLEAGGETYRCTPKTADDYVEIEKFILERRPDPFSLIAKIPASMPAEERDQLRSELLAMATRSALVSPHELLEYMSSASGIAHQIYLQTRKSRPEMNLGKAYDLVMTLGLQNASNAAAKATQVEALKN